VVQVYSNPSRRAGTNLTDAEIGIANAANQRVRRDLDPHVFNDHPPPHFHARYGEFEATIEISTLDGVEGELPPRALKLAQEWAMIHREELLKDWRLCREKAPPAKIEPLP
jgi:hypothetical protein